MLKAEIRMELEVKTKIIFTLGLALVYKFHVL